MTSPSCLGTHRNKPRVEVTLDIPQLDGIPTRLHSMSTAGPCSLTAERCENCGLLERYRHVQRFDTLGDPNAEPAAISTGDLESLAEAARRVLEDAKGQILRVDMLEWRMGERYRPDHTTHLLTVRPRVTIREA